MSEAEEKETLRRYLQNAREVLLWKLEGLSDYDIRRPMTPTGTNLLGLVKHCAGVESVYFGPVLGRPFPGQDDLDWHENDDAELGGDFYATAAEPREQVTDFYRRVWAHADATIEELPLEAARRARGHHQGIHRRRGLREDVSNLPDEASTAAWKRHYDKLQSIAQSAR